MAATAAVLSSCYRTSCLLTLLAELNIYVGQLTSEQKKDSHIKHALAVQKAMLLGNYHALFALYKDAPSMAGYLMDHFVPRERLKALIVMSKAYVHSHGPSYD